MIHEVFGLLRTSLKAKGVPFECAYGPQQVPDTVGATRIEMFRDYQSGDQINAPRGVHRNPRMVRTRVVSAVIRIFAREPVKGAMRHEHERLADRLADLCMVSLHDIAREQRVPLTVTRAGLVSDETTDGWAGVVYEIRLTVERGVFDRTYQGAANAEATLTAASVSTSVDVDGPGANPELPTATTRVDP